MICKEKQCKDKMLEFHNFYKLIQTHMYAQSILPMQFKIKLVDSALICSVIINLNVNHALNFIFMFQTQENAKRLKWLLISQINARYSLPLPKL